MFRAPVAPATLFEGIEKLPAGCWVKFDRVSGMGPEQRYWQPRGGDDRVPSNDFAEERVETAIADAALGEARLLAGSGDIRVERSEGVLAANTGRPS
jgi:asparagine synthetase B (glutamine-hydrolysing)